MAENPDEIPPEEPALSPADESTTPEDAPSSEEPNYAEEPEPAPDQPQYEEGEPTSAQSDPSDQSETEAETEPAPESGESPESEQEEIPAAGPEVTEGETLLQPCTNCATLLDVGDLEPFAKVHCPICGTAMRVRTQLKNFTLVEVLGAGGMGAVYKALDTNLNRMVALKVVRKEFSADAEYLEKFEREARITASVTHPHVVKVYSFGSDHGLFYIAMELVDKGSLDDLMNLQGRVAEIQAVAVGIQVAQGLQAAHQKGLIHRDVKPGNILFADAQTAKIVDFGLALLAEHEAEERGEVWGTPYYVAPEKLDHSPEDFRSDMYSLGGTLFHAIAGRPPFEADTASMVALKHLKSRPVSLQAFAPDVSSATAYVINRTLNKDPEKRYQSYAELIEHLEYARAQLLEAVNRPRKPRQRVVVESKSQRNVFGIITLILILVMLAAGGVLYYYRDTLFSHHVPGAPATASTEDPAAVAKKMHDELDEARKQMIAGDPTAAMATLQKLDDESDLTQPFQNWITLNEGIAALLQENLPDARGWFRTVDERSHFSSDPSDKGLVNFFFKVGEAMKGGGAVAPAQGINYALDSEEALAPFIFALKDWNLSRFEDAGRLFELYLSATPKDPFQWVGEYKPIAQKYSDDETAYEKVGAAVAAADTPDKRAGALKQITDLQSRVTGKLAARLGRMADQLKRNSASLDAQFYQQAAQAKQQDAQGLADAKRQYEAACASLNFDQAESAVNAANVTTPDGIREKDALLKKARWLRQFKELLVQDINTYGYPNPITTRTGGQVPDGPRKATDNELFVQTQFGSVPFPWTSLPPTEIIAMATYYQKTTATTAPQQAADRQWLIGVFACEEGMPKDGHPLLVQASQGKDSYKNELGLFMDSE
jgi:serine/threonine protein kinase